MDDGRLATTKGFQLVRRGLRTHICAARLMKVQGSLFIGTHLPYVTGIVERYHGELVSDGELLATGQETYSRKPKLRRG